MEDRIKSKFQSLNQRYEQLQQLLSEKDVLEDPVRLSEYAKEFSQLREKLSLFFELDQIEKQLNDLEILLKGKHEPDFLKLVQEEEQQLKKRYKTLEQKITEELRKTDLLEDKDIIMEIRAGTGGQEASLFVGDLYRMYIKYANRKGWKIENLSSHPTELGGFKEIVFGIKGEGAYNYLRFESGVHRVQRVPITEAGGRIHTSTATVAVLEEPKEIELAIDPKDLKIDVFRSSGPGGQSVNTTDSAVRITHLPTGLVVSCQDERSQLKNKNKAMRVLRARLLEMRKKEIERALSLSRKAQIGLGERSEKIRTYNFPDRRVTDHRIGLTIHRLEEIMDGNLDLIIEELLKQEVSEKEDE